MDNDVHILHRNSAKENLIAHHHRSSKTLAVGEGQPQRPHVRNEPSGAVRNRHFAFFQFLELKLEGHMFRDAKENRPCVGKRLNINRGKIRPSRVGKPQTGVG